MIFSSRSGAAMGSRALLALGLLALALPVFGASAKSQPARAKPARDTGSYRGAIVVDAATGQVLIEDHADEISPPASMTKLMTFAVLHDKIAAGELRLDQVVQIDRSDTAMGGTQVFLDPRESFPAEELIYAMMIQSANDAAHALARTAAGSTEAFVALMNAKARELGMTHTTFRSPHGLPPGSRIASDGDLTTPRDFALLCRHLVLRTDVLKYTSVNRRSFGPARAKGPMAMVNHNNLLGKIAGVDGLKTGYTKSAGYCLSATAERNGRRVIVVIMGAFGPGGKVDLGKSRDMKTIELMERGFGALPPGASNFAAERAKYVKPTVISIDDAAASSSMRASPSRPAATSAPTASTPAAPAADGPAIKFNVPRK